MSDPLVETSVACNCHRLQVALANSANGVFQMNMKLLETQCL